MQKINNPLISLKWRLKGMAIIGAAIMFGPDSAYRSRYFVPIINRCPKLRQSPYSGSATSKYLPEIVPLLEVNDPSKCSFTIIK